MTARAMPYAGLQGVLADIDVALARLFARRCPDAPREAIVAVALASWAVQQGHACLDLDVLRADASLRGLLEADPRIGPLDLDAIAAAAADARCVGVLVVDGPKVQLVRYAAYESALARSFAARLAAADEAVLAHGAGTVIPLPAAIESSFPGTTFDPQRTAVERALTHRLLVLSGGPGTGKTWTVARAIAALALRDDVRRIALAAPTGKAAARLWHSLAKAIAAIELPDAARAKLPRDAATLHRLIGLHPDRVEPRHHREHPLPYDVVVVDEASMIDLALFAKLVDAVPPHARLILVGDPDQLPAVEAGAPFAELVRFGALPAPVAGLQGELFGAPAVPSRRKKAAAPAATEPTPSPFVHLARARRFGTDSPIASLLDAIRDGDAARAITVMRETGDDSAVESPQASITWHDGPIAAHRAAFDALVRNHYATLSSLHPADALAALDRFRVLCALREGPAGVAGLNLAVEQVLGWRRRGEHGRPVLVTGNDVELGLYNGDAGVMWATPAGATVAHFAGVDGNGRRVPLAQLPPHETGYVMTVHKAQGSEFDTLAIVLPDEPHPLVTREWLYTAISRARSSVHVFGSVATIVAAVERSTVRMSGLAGRLRGRA